jgi:hypothetical protein
MASAIGQDSQAYREGFSGRKFSEALGYTTR